MARKKTTISELRVGLLAIGAIVILIIFILSVTGDIALFKRRLTYTTRFNTAEGLKAGDEVRLAGKLVGKVENVDFGAVPLTANDKPIIVSMSLDAEAVKDRIRDDSQVVPLSPEEREAIAASKTAAVRSEFATDEEVRELIERASKITPGV